MAKAVRLTVRQRISHTLYDGPRRWFYIYIYPDQESLAKAATRYAKRQLDQDHDFTGCYGCCQFKPVRNLYNRKTKTWDTLGSKTFMGNIRMVADFTDADFMVHEIVHMALGIYRDDVATDYMADFGDGNDDEKEERLCYIIGDLTNQTALALRDAGY